MIDLTALTLYDENKTWADFELYNDTTIFWRAAL